MVQRLRDEGQEVTVVSPQPSDAALVLNVQGRWSGWKLARLASQFDRLIVQFQPEMLADPGTPRRVRARSLLRLGAGLWRAPSAELYVHEVDYGSGPLGPVWRAFVGLIFGLADGFTVHSERERDDLARAFRIDEARITVRSQAEYMQPRTDADQAAARRTLGLHPDGVILLAIGFLHPRKGFDRAIRSFGQLHQDGARLYVVGSLFREDEVSCAHSQELRDLADRTPGVELHESYVNDELFDRWIVAADALVLPYRLGWSSNVMERGLLYGRPVIMSRTGGMTEQGTGRADVILVEDDNDLVEALHRVVEAIRGVE
jgi:glycosyltransferase involved in cell wall biosynthesis